MKEVQIKTKKKKIKNLIFDFLTRLSATTLDFYQNSVQLKYNHLGMPGKYFIIVGGGLRLWWKNDLWLR